MKIKTLKIVYLMLLVFSLGGCGEDMVTASIGGVNYNDYAIDEYSVDGYPAFNMYPYSRNRGGVCCIKIPREWRPGLKATIRWQDHDDEVKWKTKVVDIPEYKEVGDFYVHFFPNDEVKVLVSFVSLWHKDYPYPDPDPNHCWRGNTNTCKADKK